MYFKCADSGNIHLKNPTKFIIHIKNGRMFESLVCEFVLKFMTSLRDVINFNLPSLEINMEGDLNVENIFQNETKFYNDAKAYWSGVDPTINGMLGGFGCISSIDIKGSELFLKKIFSQKNRPNNKRALDCGAGIGRITKNLLVHNFDKVDLVEQNPKFIESAKNFLRCETNVGQFYTLGLQDFTPKNNFYDMIWCQWVLGHLTDKHLVEFLIRCKNGLRKNGVIVVKENVSSGEVIADEEDSSITRSTSAFLKVFKQANLFVFKHCKQSDFPKQLLCVKIFALKPKETDT